MDVQGGFVHGGTGVSPKIGGMQVSYVDVANVGNGCGQQGALQEAQSDVGRSVPVAALGLWSLLMTPCFVATYYSRGCKFGGASNFALPGMLPTYSLALASTFQRRFYKPEKVLSLHCSIKLELCT